MTRLSSETSGAYRMMINIKWTALISITVYWLDVVKSNPVYRTIDRAVQGEDISS